jgi:hypothetical protein
LELGRVRGFKIGVGLVKEVFVFGDGNGEGKKRENSLAEAGKKTARMSLAVPKERRKVGDYSIDAVSVEITQVEVPC